MGLLESIDAIRQAEGEHLVDWQAAAQAAMASTPRGTLDLDDTERHAYHDAVIEAKDAVERVVESEIDLPPRIEILDRHHWIDRTAISFERIVDPTMPETTSPDVARSINTTTASFTLAVLGRRVVGQYEPALFGTPEDRALYVVHPNILTMADELGVPVAPFRRWVIHHEVSHAAEFHLAPWLTDYLEARIERAIGEIFHGHLDRDALRELTLAMTVVEGFAELLMDEAIDEDVSHLRDRLEARRAGLGPLTQLIDWFLGITAKRKQYEWGRAFFLEVAHERGIEATLAVWERPEHLPSSSELNDPTAWIERVDP